MPEVRIAFPALQSIAMDRPCDLGISAKAVPIRPFLTARLSIPPDQASRSPHHAPIR